MLLTGQFLYRWTGIRHHPPQAFRYVAMQVKSFWNKKFHYNLAFHWCETQVSDGFYKPFNPQQYSARFLKIRFSQFSIWWLVAIFGTERAMYTHIEVIPPRLIIQFLQSLGGWTLLVVSIWCKYPPFDFSTCRGPQYQHLVPEICSDYPRWGCLPYCNVFTNTKFIVRFY